MHRQCQRNRPAHTDAVQAAHEAEIKSEIKHDANDEFLNDESVSNFKCRVSKYNHSVLCIARATPSAFDI